MMIYVVVLIREISPVVLVDALFRRATYLSPIMYGIVGLKFECSAHGDNSSKIKKGKK